MKIGIANDHRAYNTKEELKSLLDDYDITDYGCFSSDMVDYPEYAFKLSNAVIKKEVDLGIVMCGTGIGVSIACNKVKGIRCAKIDNMQEAQSAKEHNNANILALGARVVGPGLALDIVDTFLNAKFEGDRHINRIDKISQIEKKYNA